MRISLNGITFNNGGTVTFNGDPVTEIKYGDVTVWKKQSDPETLTATGQPSSYNSGAGQSADLVNAPWRTATSTVPSGYSTLKITAFEPAGTFGETQTQLLVGTTVVKDTGKRNDYASVTDWTGSSVSVTAGQTITFQFHGCRDINRDSRTNPLSRTISFYYE